MKININNLSFRYDRANPKILENINLEIENGEVLALMGASGTGKSTLIKLLSSFLKVTDGEILFNSKPIITDVSKCSIAYVSQTSTKSLFPWLTVEDNLYYPNRLRKNLTPENKDYCDKLLETLKLSHKRKSFPLQLSGGEQKRLTLAIAFSYHPNLFLLDEPFSGIDFKLTEELWDTLYDYFKNYKPTVILATHSLDEASIIADYVLFFNNKKGVQKSLKKLFDFERSNSTPRNLLLYKDTIIEYKKYLLEQFNAANFG